MKKLLVILTILVLIAAGYFLLKRKTHIVVQNTPAPEANLGEYGYRCGDGTEFTITPASDMSSILVTPSTSVERIPKITLLKKQADKGVLYSAQGIVFAATGETVTLTTSSFQTTCTPMQTGEAPFNFGD